MKKGITVLICTYNGAPRLAATLSHLAAQSMQKNLDWEIIVVDNASTDQTSAIAISEWEKHSIPNVPLTVIHEKTPGKLFAFQEGIRKAKYEYFIICDDDNWLSNDYLNIAFDILESNPKIGALGGQTIPATEPGIPLPVWFEASKESYAVGKQSLNTGNITSRGHLWGAGLVSRTELYQEVYKAFPSLLINKENPKILSTEDTEYCLRIVLKGYELYYDDRLSLKHFIPSGRLALEYKDGLQENFSNAHPILEKYYIAIKFGTNRLNLFNKLRLTLITPFRYFLASNPAKKAKQKTILAYLLPSIVAPDTLTSEIWKFMKS